jgi:hypothetical protein
MGDVAAYLLFFVVMAGCLWYIGASLGNEAE